MERFLMSELVKWKESSRRKPLILNGARQVGKTWLLKEFGRLHFKNVAYVNFDNNPGMRQQFETDYDIQRLLLVIQAESGEYITPGETLVILDEIQECPKALTSLKYFNENAPEYAVVVAGSLLGVTVHEGTGYPVGKVSSLNLYPLSFREYLDATGNEHLRKLIDDGDESLIDAFSSKFVTLLKQYYYVGGMPEAVVAFLESRAFEDARKVQQEILFGYERDISKHLSATETEHTLAVWRSIPTHLGRENKKFIFGHIREGARARNYRSAITWLTHAGISVRIPRISQPGIPLAGYADDQAFKLFLLDVGLLGAMADLDLGSIVDGNMIFTHFKGALTEQYVCQQLISDCNVRPYYWSAENSRGEIDFVVQTDGAVYPIEVKAEENVRAKSLRAFSERFSNVNSRRFSLSGFRDQEWMKNIPLYACSNKDLWV